MAYKGNLTNKTYRLKSLFVEVFGFTTRFLLHNSFSECQWLKANLIFNYCNS